MGKDGQIHQCEIQAYAEHDCEGGLELNEVLYPRNIYQKAKQKVKDYFMLNEINLCICCSYSHQRWGHSRFFRMWFVDQQVQRYSTYKVKDFINNSPIKIRRPK